ncbi:MAG: DUF2802 domain-containing protein [Sulfuritalea sp.]|jgi:hypothetical protein|nr:DUF2802 domain-containing protein [Sulfuritalea sp.]
MSLEFMSGVNWRDVVLALAALIGVYLVLSVMRLFQVGGRHHGGAKKEARSRFSGWEPYSSHQGPEPQPVPADTATMVSEPKFTEELARSNVDVELDRLRRESVQLREELARLTEEVSRLKAARNVSPLYNEATALAQQGMPAAGIAGHCGISIGEAELVAALARGGSEFERQEQDEVRDERNIQSGN